MNILVTGCAGFIGYHLTKKLLENKKYIVFGIDNINTYYDTDLKRNRLKLLKENTKKFFFEKIDIANLSLLEKNFKKNNYDIVFNLAAHAGVRSSIKNPSIYFKSNLVGFFNIINLSKECKIKHLIYASSSSVYGDQKKLPLKENFSTDMPLSFYASTKKTNEVIAYSYSSVYQLPTTGVRFFTVYGPMGRPDMAVYKFTHNIFKNKRVELFNNGNNYRDFTYIDDVVYALCKILKKPPKSVTPFKIINIGSGQKIKTSYLISLIENKLGKKTKKIKLPPQIGDVKNTQASNLLLKNQYKFKPKISIEEGISRYITWFKNYYL